MKKILLCIDRGYVFIQNIVFIISIMSFTFICIFLYTYLVKGKENARIISDLDEKPFLIDFAIPYILPIAMASFYYIITVFLPRIVAFFLHKVYKTKEFDECEIIIARFFYIFIFVSLVYYVFKSNIELSNIFTDTSFEKTSTETFTGIFAVTLFIFDGLKMYRVSYLHSLKAWITSDKNGIPYSRLCNIRAKINDSLDSACL